MVRIKTVKFAQALKFIPRFFIFLISARVLYFLCSNVIEIIDASNSYHRYPTSLIEDDFLGYELVMYTAAIMFFSMTFFLSLFIGVIKNTENIPFMKRGVFLKRIDLVWYLGSFISVLLLINSQNISTVDRKVSSLNDGLYKDYQELFKNLDTIKHFCLGSLVNKSDKICTYVLSGKSFDYLNKICKNPDEFSVISINIYVACRLSKEIQSNEELKPYYTKVSDKLHAETGDFRSVFYLVFPMLIAFRLIKTCAEIRDEREKERPKNQDLDENL